MPYILRKKLEEVGEYPIRLQFNLPDNEKICKYHDLNHDFRLPTYLRTSSIIVVNKDFSVERVINKPFDFQVISVGHYTGGRDCQCIYDRQVMLPHNLVKDYAIDSTKSLELHVKQVVHNYPDVKGNIESTEIEEVFPEANIEGSIDFEVKDISGHAVNESELLVETHFDDEFFESLKFEINTAFRIGLYTATIVLLRKLFERQIIDVMRQKYGMANMILFYSDGYFLNLSELIRNLRDKLDDFKPYDFFKLEREKQSFIDFLWNLREEGNAGAHSMPYLGYNEIVELKPSINKYSDLLIRMYKKVKEIPS